MRLEVFTPVPETGSSLVALGLNGLASVRRRYEARRVAERPGKPAPDPSRDRARRLVIALPIPAVALTDPCAGPAGSR